MIASEFARDVHGQSLLPVNGTHTGSGGPCPSMSSSMAAPGGTWRARLPRFVRQVYRCLHQDIGEPTRAEIQTALHRPGPRLVIAHSLGSDMLTRDDTGLGPDGLTTTLVACGSRTPPSNCSTASSG